MDISTNFLDFPAVHEYITDLDYEGYLEIGSLEENITDDGPGECVIGSSRHVVQIRSNLTSVLVLCHY
jgi:hypothetical protein